MSIVAVATVAAGAGLVAAVWPRFAYRLAVPTTEPPRSGCAPCGRRFPPGWRGRLRFGRACRTCPAGPPGPWWAVSALVALAAGALTWHAHPGHLDRRVLLLAWLIVVETGGFLAIIDLAVHRLPTPLVTATAVGVATCIAAAALVGP